MADIKYLFFELIRIAIGNAVCLSRMPSDEEWQQLFIMAKKQSLLGVCFAGLQKLQKQGQCPPDTLYLKWMGMAAKIQHRNEVMNKQCVEVQGKILDKGIQSCILKGQGVGALYHVHDSDNLSMLRQSGDIDVLLYKNRLSLKENRKAVMDFARELEPNASGSEHHVHVKAFPSSDSANSAKVEVELHYVPSYFCNPCTNRRFRRWCEAWMSEGQRLKVNVHGSEFDVPSVEFNMVFLLAHTFRHYVSEGVGLRQIMDYYFVLHSVQKDPSSNFQEITETLKSLGLLKFAGAVMWVLGKVFGMEREKMICEPKERLGKKLLEHIMQGGNFGHYNGEKVVKSGAHWANFVNQVAHDLHLAIDYPQEALWSPISMIIEFLRIRF